MRPKAGVGTPPGQQDTEATTQPVGQLLVGAVLVDAGQWLEGRVGVLDDEPATRSQHVDHGAATAWRRRRTWTSTRRAWTRSNGPGGGWSRPHVVTEHRRSPVRRAGVEPREVDVGGQHRSPRTRPVRPCQAATLGPPAPTSQHRQPAPIHQVARGGGRSTGRTARPGRPAVRPPRSAGCRAGSPRSEALSSIGSVGSRCRSRVLTAAQESTRLRKLRSPRPRNRARNPDSTG